MGCSVGRKPYNLVGKKYGRLSPLRIGKTKPRGKNGTVYYWICLCDCGNETEVSVSQLGSGHTRSCGCLRDRTEDSVLRSVVSIYKSNARSKGRDFDMPDEDILSLLKDECHYCGAPPSNKRTLFGISAVYSGIDRVDTSKGYITGNVVTCCIDCNKAKSALSVEKFISMCKAVASRF